ncbi:hypothetical protein CIB48_g6716 [Xylaria polymorpha]|nr:hypothetical protein CIB48_g6716 [Xylaria polymorpha]
MVKVVIAGGSGQVAREVVDALVATKKHDITIFSRGPAPTAAIPSNVKWQAVDYNDKGALTEALRGTHTALSFVQLLSDPDQTAQKNLIDAAISAGSRVRQHGLVAGKTESERISTRSELDKTVIEYTLFQPGLFLDYLAFPQKTSKYVDPLQTVFDFKNRRALVIDGHEDATMTFTTVTDAAAVIARAVDYDGEWPTMGGIRGNAVSISELLNIGGRVRGRPFTIEKMKIEDLEAGELKASWGLEAVHKSVSDEQAQALLKMVCIGTLLSSSKGAWDSSDEMNQIFPEYEFTPIEEFLSKVWDGKP